MDTTKPDETPTVSLSIADADALVASRSDAFNTANACIALIAAAGAFLSEGMLHRAAYASVVVATYFATHWLVRCISATMRDDLSEARNLATMTQVAWFYQKVALLVALGLTVLTAPGT